MSQLGSGQGQCLDMAAGHPVSSKAALSFVVVLRDTHSRSIQESQKSQEPEPQDAAKLWATTQPAAVEDPINSPERRNLLVVARVLCACRCKINLKSTSSRQKKNVLIPFKCK